MAQELRTPLALANVSAEPDPPPTGSLTVYAAAGKLSAKNEQGAVVTLGERYYQTVQDGAGTALTQRKILRFKNLAVADDPTGEVTLVSGPGTDRAAIDFLATDFVGETLTIQAADVPFSYANPILQVVDSDCGSVLVGTSVDPTTKDITVTAVPFDGKLLIINT